MFKPSSLIYFLLVILFSHTNYASASKYSTFYLNDYYKANRFFESTGQSWFGFRAIASHNDPTPLTYTISVSGALANHITIDESSFTLAAGEDHYIGVYLNGTGLSEGEYTGNITITSEKGDRRTHTVYLLSSDNYIGFYSEKMCVENLPESYQHNSWDMNTSVLNSSKTITKTVTIWNCGGSQTNMSYNVEHWEDASQGLPNGWVKLSGATSGSLELGQRATIRVQYDLSLLHRGVYEHVIRIPRDQYNVGYVFGKLTVIDF